MQYSDEEQHVTQLALFSDLSLRVITLMTIGELGHKYAAAEVAESFNVFHAHVFKVVSRLVELGFLGAVKGRSSDIHLRDSATDKFIGKLLRILENNGVVGCVGTDCPLLPTCLLCGKLAAVQEAFSAAFDSVLIAGLIPVRSVDGVDDDTPEGDNMPKGSILSVRPVQVQS